MLDHREKAIKIFEDGYNCAQAVFLAFCDVTGLDEKTAITLSSSFGGGMGRMREVCGAVSGMFMVAGILYGYEDPKAKEEKAEHYARIQALAKDFCDISAVRMRYVAFGNAICPSGAIYPLRGCDMPFGRETQIKQKGSES